MSYNEDFNFFITFDLFICVYVLAHVEVRTRCRNQFSLSILWGFGCQIRHQTPYWIHYITHPMLRTLAAFLICITITILQPRKLVLNRG